MAKKPHPHYFMVKTIKGDLVKLAKESRLFDVYIHGCNCRSIFGAGLARQIAQAFPMVYMKDMKSKLKPEEKLGKFTYHTIKNETGARIYIINAYTQFSVGTGVQVDYVAMRDSFEAIRTMFGGCQMKFAMPMIGAGLGGGDWNKIKTIIEDVFKDENLTVIDYDKN